VTFKKGSSFSFLFDINAPYMIEFKNLVNTYGISNNADGSDTLNMYIYSDFLKESVKVPQFEIKDNEIIMFSDLVVPCINELIVNIAKDQTVDQKPTYNTIRIDCNAQTTGYSQREFRFHDVVMDQVDQEDGMDLATIDYFANTAINLFNRVILDDLSSDPLTVAEIISYKNFANAAMFQVSEIFLSEKEAPYKETANASYSLSVKNIESFRLARRYADQGE